MKKYIVMSLVFLIGCSASNSSLQSVRTEKRPDGTPEIVLRGTFRWSDWKANSGWTKTDAADYTPNPQDAEQLGKAFNLDPSLHIVVFAGSWCGDSKVDVPMFWKLIRAADISETRISLYGVDRTKRDSTSVPQSYRITNVPTYVFIKDGKELGRVTEHPAATLEKDFLGILSK
jgi:thiol-disulfide isomerase/thioredoxin